MHIFGQAILLFTLNFLDAVFTVFWVRNGYATEGNFLMASLLDIGDLPFLLVKLAVGTIAAVVLWRYSNFRLAKFGLGFSLFLYIALMGVHFVTGLTAAGLLSESFVAEISNWSRAFV